MAGLAGFLKGADAVVLAAAKHLKLTATFLPIWQCSGDYESDASEDARGWTRWRMPRDSEDEDSEYADLKDDDLKDDDIEIVVIDQEPFQGVLGKSFDAQMHDIYGRFLHQTRVSAVAPKTHYTKFRFEVEVASLGKSELHWPAVKLLVCNLSRYA